MGVFNLHGLCTAERGIFLIKHVRFVPLTELPEETTWSLYYCFNPSYYPYIVTLLDGGAEVIGRTMQRNICRAGRTWAQHTTVPLLKLFGPLSGDHDTLKESLLVLC